jgi:conserved hypothetical integral membrane protein
VNETSTHTREHAIELDRPEADTLGLRIAGDWHISTGMPCAEAVVEAIEQAPTRQVAVRAVGLGTWDSSLLTFLLDVHDACVERGVACDLSALPEGVRRLMALATAVPERDDAKRRTERRPFLEHIGAGVLDYGRNAGNAIGFLGECLLSFGRLLRGRRTFRRSDLVLFVQQAGFEALAIVSLIAILIGMILAFVGAVQLRIFAAQAYIANLVAIAMLREMGAMMTAIIMAGRTGAAYAAQLGTMQVNEEVDALRTFGVAPFDYLVMPRILALVLMMPLLTLYADFVGILGGYLVGTTMFDVSASQYIQATLRWFRPQDFALGLIKSVVFGIIIAGCGCLAGMQSGRSAAAVGSATTTAVVNAIVWIVVADGIFAVVTSVLRI